MTRTYAQRLAVILRDSPDGRLQQLVREDAGTSLALGALREMARRVAKAES